MAPTIVIVGGVAGGASAATRARRLSEDAEIIVIERGPYVSFANCGLPYYVGGEIEDRNELTLQTPASLRARFGLDVRVREEAVRIFPETRELEIRKLETSEIYRQHYDELVLATGAVPLRPPIPGIESSRLFTVRDIPDVDRIKGAMAEAAWKRVAILGAGYIGLEMAEQLSKSGLKVVIIEALPQVMAPLDPEMAQLLHAALRAHGITLHLADPVRSFTETPEGALCIETNSGKTELVDAGILGLGIRPETTLAQTAGIALGERGGVKVDEYLRTNVAHIWAVGDCIEVRDTVTDAWGIVPLAGPANRQGRMVADNIFGKARRYQGTQGTAILRLFGLAAACTGANEKTLRRTGAPYKAIHLHPGSHAGYFPGAKPIAMKLLFEPASGRLLGAQAVGEDGVDKRIDVLATALKAGLTVEDLAELELAYAPPFGSAKDPVNLLGMAAQNIREGFVETISWNELEDGMCLLDVREPSEFARGHIPGALHIPLNDLRARIGEVPRDREVIAYCHAGQRSYYACRILSQHGIRCRNLSGAWKTWSTATAKP